MSNKFFAENKLECNTSNESFVRYLSDLKNLFEKVKNIDESDGVGESKNILLEEFGRFLPNLYHLRSETNKYFVGEFANKTTEIILRYNEVYDALSDERVNFLTGQNVEVTRNRIKLFLTQQLRDIDSVLS